MIYIGHKTHILFGNERLINLYTKSGDIGVYSGVLALSLDHDVGFIILGAGNNTHILLIIASDLILVILIPTLEQSAKN